MGFKGQPFGTGCVYIHGVPVLFIRSAAVLVSQTMHAICLAFACALSGNALISAACQAFVGHLSGFQRNQEATGLWTLKPVQATYLPTFIAISQRCCS